MLKSRCLASAMMLLLTVAAAQAASSPVEMLRDLFRSPVTEWKQILAQSKPLLTEDFFTNVEKRVRWGIENNHIDDAMRFAMVGDFGAQIKGRPAPYRIDLAKLFFDAQNYTMAGQMVDNIMITDDSNSESYKQAKHLGARMAEMRQDFFNAHNLYVELAKAGYEEGEMWFKAGTLSMNWLEQETRAKDELQRAVKAGHIPAGLELEKLIAREKGDWSELIPPQENSPETQQTLNQTQQPTQANDKDKMLVEAAAAVDSGNLQQAKTLYQELNRQYARDPEITRQLSALLYRMGNLEEARAFLDEAIAASPQNAELLRFRGNTEERMYDRSRVVQHLEKALADYSQAVKLAPNHQFLVIEYQRAQAKHALVSGR